MKTSETKRLSKEFIAKPETLENLAAVPIPFTNPEEFPDPAKVVTIPEFVIFRMAQSSATNRFPVKSPVSY
ncbi:hypothetical protein [Leptospira yasudae]|uniref:Uncharacterized protein n=1 Tax=Leptospira yasudae TaxID=2202201 RepID=A0A6N4QPC4_9LEPT|nr:hypothetical protein [Leptospira yasudae]TGL73526.1 hypothetical protein EHQ72_19815 [Leptospira yasudae]TGL83668.1 hypothetical protein EHQ77_01015 [Leptospira yasudae]TGL89592.1 hypothetical protein EHQ83_00975 [Leptospira yasudae]